MCLTVSAAAAVHNVTREDNAPLIDRTLSGVSTVTLYQSRDSDTVTSLGAGSKHLSLELQRETHEAIDALFQLGNLSRSPTVQCTGTAEAVPSTMR